MDTRYIVQIAEDESPTQTMRGNNKIAFVSTDTQINEYYDGKLEQEAIKEFILPFLRKDNFREKRQKLENAKYICLILNVGRHQNKELCVKDEDGACLEEIAHIEEIYNEYSLKQMNRLYISDRIPKEIIFENKNENIKKIFKPDAVNIF